MRNAAAVTFAAVAVMTLVPVPSDGQDRDHSAPVGIARTLLEGVIAGTALGVAYIQPTGEGWLVSDGSALPLSAIMGVTTAFIGRSASRTLPPDAPRRPQLRMALGRSSITDVDYSMALRVPIVRPLMLQGAVTVTSDTWEKIETETRCDPWVGCLTGEYVTDSRYEQSVALTFGGVLAPLPRSPLNPTLTLGVGPVVTNIEAQESGRSRHTGVMAEAMLGLELSRRSRWTAEAGARMSSEDTPERVVVQARIGRAFGF